MFVLRRINLSDSDQSVRRFGILCERMLERRERGLGLIFFGERAAPQVVETAGVLLVRGRGDFEAAQSFVGKIVAEKNVGEIEFSRGRTLGRIDEMSRFC